MTADSSPLHIPIEVIERIIDSAHDLIYEHDDFHDRDLYSIWKSCSLTCRAMVPRSQYWLFRVIVLDEQSQADRLVAIIRQNPIVAQHTRELTISGPSEDDSKVEFTWISWIPLLLAPRMTKLEVLWLDFDIFSESHPSLPTALTAFKSIRRLDIHKVEFATFERCSRFIQAFPRLDHLGFKYISWKREPLSSSIPQRWITRPRRLQIPHLDLWGTNDDGSDLHKFTEWLAVVQDEKVLQTLNLEADNHSSIPKILRRGPLTRSIFLQLSDDGPVRGFANLAYLQMIHVETFHDDMFPIQAVASIVLSMRSQRIQKLLVYITITKQGDEGWENIEDPSSDILDAYAKLDDALCTPSLQHLEFTVCLLHAASAVTVWRHRLSSLLPKSFALGRIQVRSIPTLYPHWRWEEECDGF